MPGVSADRERLVAGSGASAPAPLPGRERLAAFEARVWEAGERYGRPDLPWRYVDDPYAVYVSEAMLQQTQVARVLSYWPRFLHAFSTIDALATPRPPTCSRCGRGSATTAGRSRCCAWPDLRP